MLTYHTYDPSKDVLEKGMQIRIAGRSATIGAIEMANACGDTDEWPHLIKWEGREDDADWLNLRHFPAVEIADPPLTISKRLKVEIAKWFPTHGVTQMLSNEHRQSFHEWLDSIEETD